MIRKLILLVIYSFLAANLCGCALVMGMLGDSAKAKQNISISYGSALETVKTVFKDQDIKFESADIREDIAEVKGKSADGRAIRIIISKISDTECRVSVRAGTSETGRKVADKILEDIVRVAGMQVTNAKIK